MAVNTGGSSLACHSLPVVRLAPNGPQSSTVLWPGGWGPLSQRADEMLISFLPITSLS